MVKKVKFETSKKADDFDLDSFLNDTADYTKDIDFGDASKPVKGSTFRSIKKGIVSGAKSAVKSPSFYKTIIKSVMPREYGDALDSSADIYRTLGNLYSDSVRDLKPEFQQIARQVDKMVPDEQKTLKKFTDRMKKMTGADLDSQSSSPTADQLRDVGISTTLNELFGLRAEQSVKQRARDKAQNLIDKQVDLKRFNVSAQLMTGIHTGISRLNAYNDRINQAYQRKSLELQMRSVFIQTDALALARTSIETIGRQNNEIIRLLAMPDQEKILASKNYQKSKAGLFGNAARGLLTKDTYLGGVRERLKDAVGSKVQGIKSSLETGLFGIEQAQDASEMMEGMDKSEMITSILVGGGLEALAGKVGSKFRNKILPAGSKGDNFLGRLLSMIRDPAALAKMLKEKVDASPGDYGTLRGGIKDKLGSLLDMFAPSQMKVSLGTGRMSMNELNAPGQFTNKVALSITNIIPGYLSRILREIQISRTGVENTELTVYNPLYGKFVSQSASGRIATKEIKKKLSNYGFTSAIESAMKDITDGATISDKAKDVLKQRIQSVAFNPEESAHISNVLSEDYISRQTPAVQKELRNLSSKYSRTAQMHGRNINVAHRAVLNVRENISDERGFIEELSRDPGLLKAMVKDGIVTGSVSTGYKINTKKYQEYAAADTDFNSSDIIKHFKEKNLYEAAIRAGILKRKGEKITVDKTKYQLYIQGRIRLKANGAFEDDDAKGIFGKVFGSSAEGESVSDYNAKSNIATKSPKGILDGIMKTRFPKWKYKDGQYAGQDFVGPMAQDIQKNLGEEFAPGGKKINLVSLNGASMSAISYMGKQLDMLKDKIGRKESGQTTTNSSSLKSMLEQIAENTRKTYEALEAKSFGFNMPISGLDMDTVHELVKKGQIKIDDLYGNAKEYSKQGFQRMSSFYRKLFKSSYGLASFGISSAARLGGKLLQKGFSFAKNTAIPYLSQGFKRMHQFGSGLLDVVKNGIHNAVNPVVDIYKRGDLTTPVLLAKNIIKGLYINKDTGKPIFTLSDITGPVIDAAGNEIITLVDIKEGLVNVQGLPIQNFTNKLKSFANTAISKMRVAIFEKLPAGIKQLAQGIATVGNFVKNAINQPKDIYVKTKMDYPVLFAKDFYTGKYIDLKTKNVIRTLGDIRGPVVDKQGNYIVTQDDIAAGLVDVNGKPIESMQQHLTGMAMAGIGALKGIASNAINKVAGFLKGSRIGSSGFGNINLFGKKTTSLLTEIRDILKQHFEGGASSMPYGMDEGLDGGNHYESQNAVAGDSFSTIKNAAQGAKGLFNSARSKLPGLKSKLSGMKLAGRVGSFGSKALGLLKRVPGASLLGKVGSMVGGLASSFLGSPSDAAANPEAAMQNQEVNADIHSEQESSNKMSLVNKLRNSAYSTYNDVRTHLLGSRAKGTNMLEVNAREKELEQQRQALNINTAHASLAPKYMGGSTLLNGIMGKLSGFKKMLSGAFDFITNIPGLGKLGKVLSKVPGIGKLFGVGKAVAGVGEAAEDAGSVAEGAEATAGVAGAVEGGGMLAALGGGAAAIGSTVLSGAMAVGGALLSGAAAVVASPVLLTGLAVAGVAAAAYFGYKFLTRNKVSPLEQYRMTQYGLTPEQSQNNHVLLNLEKYYDKILRADNNGLPAIDKQALDFGKILGILDVDPGNKAMVQRVAIYINKRFNPVYLYNTTAVWCVNSKLKVSDIDSMTPIQLKQYIAKASYMQGPYSVTTSPFSDLPKLTSNLNWVKFVYEKAVAFVNSKVANKTKTAATKPAAASGATAYDAAFGIKKKAAANPIKDFHAQQKKAAAATSAAHKQAVAQIKQVAGAATLVKPRSPMGAAGSPGQALTNPSDINNAIHESVKAKAFASIKVPGGALSSSREAMKTLVGKVASSVGVKPQIAQVITGIESSFNPDAHASTSSASGLFQFIHSTWDSMVSKYGPQYGLSMNTSPLDPKANALMGSLFIKQNLKDIRSVAPNPTAVDAYIAHFLGPGGAKVIIRAKNNNSNTPAYQMLPDAARANPTLFFKDGDMNQPFTATDFYNNITNLVNYRAKEYGLGNVTTSKILEKATNKPTLSSGTNINIAGKPAFGIHKAAASNKTTSTFSSMPIPAAKPAPSQTNAPSLTHSLSSASKPIVVTDSGQGLHMQKLHGSMQDVSNTLSQSLAVQQKMLESLVAIATNTGILKTATGKTAGTHPASTTLPPKPSIDLSRGK